MGGKRRVARAVDDLVRQFIRGTEADIEKCLRRGYALVLGDGDCVLSTLMRSGVVEEEVSFLSYPSIVVVRKGSPQYDDVARYVGGVVGGAVSPDIILVRGEGGRCSYEVLVIVKGDRGDIARDIARVLAVPLVFMKLTDIVDNMEGLMSEGTCEEERECLKYMLEHAVIYESVCD